MTSFSKKAVLETKKTITNEELQQFIKRPRDFMYYGDKKDVFIKRGIMCLGCPKCYSEYESRQVRSIKSNVDKLVKNGTLNKDNIEFVTFSHWAVGIVENILFLAIDDEGNATNECAFVKLLTTSNDED